MYSPIEVFAILVIWQICPIFLIVRWAIIWHPYFFSLGEILGKFANSRGISKNLEWEGGNLYVHFLFQVPDRSATSMYKSSSMTSYSVVNDERRGSTLSANIYKKRSNSNCLRNTLTQKENEIVMRNVNPNNEDENKVNGDNISGEQVIMLNPSDD